MGPCIKCHERWVSMKAAHCTGCHQMFKSVSGFDKHRVGMKCNDPDDLGMQMDERGFYFAPRPCGLEKISKRGLS